MNRLAYRINNRQHILAIAVLLILPFIALACFWLGLPDAQAAETTSFSQVDTCFATHNNGVTVFSSANAHAVQRAVDATSAGGEVKVAGLCVGVEPRASTSQSVYISKTLTLSGGYTTTNWTTGTPVTHHTIIDASQSGRTIYATAALTVTNITLQRGSINSSGGGLYTISALWLTNTNFISNTALGFGGGAYAYGAVTVSGSRFENNHSAESLRSGGGLYANSSLWLTDTKFISNTATESGGGAYAWGTATVISSWFENNRSTGMSGGGMYANQTLLLIDSHIIGNMALAPGGGIFAGQAVTATGNRFEKNDSTGGVGGGLYTASTLRLTDTLFISNTAAFGGGGASVGDAATVIGSRFENNSSADGEGGGLIAWGTLWLTNTQFLRNRAATDGGGAYLTDAGRASSRRLMNVLLAGNQADGEGHALYANHYVGNDKLMILHSTIVSPILTGGVAVVVANGKAVISNTIIANHTVGIQQSDGSLVTQDYNLFFGNIANTSGTVDGGSHSLVDNPAFANPAADDYRLMATSAALNIGADVGVYTDFEGNRRPLGGGFDAGYDESLYTTDASIAKTATLATASPEETISYMLHITSTGTGQVSGLVVRDNIPTSVTVTGVSSNAMGSGIVIAQISPAPNLAWSINKLVTGESAVITVTGMVSANSALVNTSFVNMATITGTNDVTPTNDSSSAVLHIVGLPGTIIVKKVVVGEPPTSDWQFVGPTGAFTLPAPGGSVVFSSVAVGSYTINETVQPNYEATSVCSNGAAGGASVNVILGSGQTITCTFKNTLRKEEPSDFAPRIYLPVVLD
jgi:uncharacterized repeat protein (TIGR01451 family)